MYSIHPDQSIPLWTALNQFALHNPSWYLHPEAYSLRLLTQRLWAPIEQQFLPLAYYSVQFRARSSSGTVFLLNAPTTVSGQTTAIFRHNQDTFAVKVFRDETAYTNEIQSLQCISQSLGELDGQRPSPLLRNQKWKSSQFYALAHANFWYVLLCPHNCHAASNFMN